MDKKKFLEILNENIPSQNKKGLLIRIQKAVEEKDTLKALQFLNIYNTCFPKGEIKEKIIETIVNLSPWEFFSKAPSEEYLQLGISIFRRKICHYLGEEFLKYRTGFGVEDAHDRVDQILANLDSNIKFSKEEPSFATEGFHFAPSEVQSGTMVAFIFAGYLIISATFFVSESLSSKKKFLEALNKALHEIEHEERFYKQDLNQAKAIIEKLILKEYK